MQIGTARASGISRETVKSRCAREWGAWGRISEDGPGQHNPDRSEGPWGRAVDPSARRCWEAQHPRHSAGKSAGCRAARRGMANQLAGKASSESPALKPYWGKPAVRNFRGDDGNVGIIRSPVRAIALPDNRHEAEEEEALQERSSEPLGLESCAATVRDAVKRR